VTLIFEIDTDIRKIYAKWLDSLTSDSMDDVSLRDSIAVRREVQADLERDAAIAMEYGRDAYRELGGAFSDPDTRPMIVLSRPTSIPTPTSTPSPTPTPTATPTATPSPTATPELPYIPTLNDFVDLAGIQPGTIRGEKLEELFNEYRIVYVVEGLLNDQRGSRDSFRTFISIANDEGLAGIATRQFQAIANVWAAQTSEPESIAQSILIDAGEADDDGYILCSLAPIILESLVSRLSWPLLNLPTCRDMVIDYRTGFGEPDQGFASYVARRYGIQLVEPMP
jgi:hypothetical protein